MCFSLGSISISFLFSEAFKYFRKYVHIIFPNCISILIGLLRMSKAREVNVELSAIGPGPNRPKSPIL